MQNSSPFDLTEFTPYLLNLAAEASSRAFQRHYRDTYGMLRTEWRVLFHLGRYGPMMARDICTRGGIHKTKVSRAVAALQEKRFLTRSQSQADRRQEVLTLTPAGQAAFAHLVEAARQFDTDLVAPFTEQEQQILKACLLRLANL